MKKLKFLSRKKVAKEILPYFFYQYIIFRVHKTKLVNTDTKYNTIKIQISSNIYCEIISNISNRIRQY